MSFDLFFCRENGPTPTIQELKTYFSALPSFQINDVAAGGVQFWYQNDATGVCCDFSYSPLDANEMEGCGSSGLTFNLNFVRPSFFAYETMPLVEAFCKHFDLIVEDPQAETLRPADASQLIDSWRSNNAHAVRAMIQADIAPDIKTNYLPEPRATEWWRYMFVKQRLDEAMKEDIFVPSLMILIGPAGRPFTMMGWPHAIAQFFPPCEYVYVQREKKRLFRTTEEMGLVPYQSVRETIDPLLDDYQFGGLQLKYLRPEKVPDAARLIQTFHLEPIELSQHSALAPNIFHDIA